MPGPVIQRTGTYRLLGSLLLYVVKRDGESVEEEFSALKRRHPFFLVIKTRATPWTGWKKRESEGEREGERKKEGGREGGRIFRNFSVEKMDAGRGKGCADDA